MITNQAFAGDCIVRVEYSIKEENPLSVLFQPTFRQAVYKVEPSDEQVKNDLFEEFLSIGGDLEKLNITITKTVKQERPISHSGTAQP